MGVGVSSYHQVKQWHVWNYLYKCSQHYISAHHIAPNIGTDLMRDREKGERERELEGGERKKAHGQSRQFAFKIILHGWGWGCLFLLLLTVILLFISGWRLWQKWQLSRSNDGTLETTDPSRTLQIVDLPSPLCILRHVHVLAHYTILILPILRGNNETKWDNSYGWLLQTWFWLLASDFARPSTCTRMSAAFDSLLP